jgi:hypothetical protein
VLESDADKFQMDSVERTVVLLQPKHSVYNGEVEINPTLFIWMEEEEGSEAADLGYHMLKTTYVEPAMR